MRSFHAIGLLIIVIFLFITFSEGNTFTVHRPKEPAGRKTTRAPGEITQTTQSAAPTGSTSPTNVHYTGGGPGPGGPTTPPATPGAMKSSSPSPAYTPPNTSKKSFPFIIAFVLLTIVGLVIWYFTRNINFKRLFK
jgi:hypothetical protein